MKIIDVEVMPCYCQECIPIEAYKTDVALYEKYKIDHDCTINHSGSALAMEQVGINVYSIAQWKKKLRYIKYYGDGDTKAFRVVENMYADTKVLKKEYIGHIQKPVGNKLRKKKKTETGLAKLGLVSAVIDKLPNYYGMAVRGNVGNIIAAWCHVCSSEKNYFHVHCPERLHSWCTFQCDIAISTKTHVPGNSLPLEVIKHCQRSI